MSIDIELPTKLNYQEFVQKLKKFKKFSCCYKITFNDDLFYIGSTGNLAGRIYNHISMHDSIGAKKLSKKQKRMLLAIKKNKKVKFEIISKDYNEESFLLKKYKDQSNCLNMKN